MRTPLAPLIPVAARLDTPLQHRADLPAVDVPLTRRLAGWSLLLGGVADLLLHDTPRGTGFPVWMALLALVMIATRWRSHRDLTGEVSLWLCVALLFACGVAWRDSALLTALDVLVSLGALGMAAISANSPAAGLFALRLRDTAWAAFSLARTVAAGFLPIAARELFGSEMRGLFATRIVPVVRALLIATSLLVVFGTLLANADPIFENAISFLSIDVDLVVAHTVVIVFYTWMVAGWSRAAFVVDLGKHRAPDTLPFSLTVLDVTTALGTLNVLFAAFIVAQVSWMFGGETFLREHTGLTASAYARRGFFEMLWVVLLVVPLLVATRALLAPGRAAARRHTLLAIPVVVLLAAILVSAAMRLRMYVHFFGLTTDRFYPLAFMAWLGLVLPWLAFTVLRDRGRLFVAGVALSGLATLAALNVVSPDASVARFNVDRAGHPSRDSETGLDLRALASLSAEAADVAIRAVIAAPATRAPDPARCDAAIALLGKWGPSSNAASRAAGIGAWRSRNAGEATALRLVSAHAHDLAVARAQSCVKKPA